MSLLFALSLSTAGAANRCHLAMTPALPVKMDDLRPVITASINGTAAQFIVDTGSFFDFLSPAAAAEFKLPLSHAPYGYFVSGIGGSMVPRIATASTFTVAGISVHRALFLVGNNDFQSSEVGLLGENLFRIADVDYDFANGALRFVEPDHCRGQVLAYWATTQPIGIVKLRWTSKEQPHLIGGASVNGRSIEVLFDTGSPRTILSLRAAKRAGITPTSPGVTPAGFTSGLGSNAVKVWVAPIDRFEIGGEAIEHTHVLIGDIDLRDLDADMLLGTDFFLAHHVYVANSQDKLYFTYNGGPVFDLNAQRPAQAASTSKVAPDSAPPNPPPDGRSPQASPQSLPGPGQLLSGSAAAASQHAIPAVASNIPTDAAGFMRRGMAESARGEYLEAIDDLTRACGLDPSNADCPYQRGLAYWHAGQGPSAIADFDSAIRLRSDDFDAYLARAEFEMRGQRDRAETDLDAVDRFAPQQADLRLQVAKLYDAAGEYAGAVHQYDLWIDYHSDDIRLPYALSSRCGSEAAANVDVDRALQDCNEALRLMGKHAPASASAIAMSNRGMAYLRQGRLDRALTDLNAALNLESKLPVARFARGLVELKKGMKDQGQSDLAAAEAQRPGIDKRLAAMGLKP